MKIQDEHDQIWVSGALDWCKVISQKIPKKSGVFSQKNPMLKGNFKKLASGLWPGLGGAREALKLLLAITRTR